MAIGFLVAITWATKRAPKYGVSPNFVSNLSFWIIVSSILGGRLVFMLISEPLEDLFSFKFFEVWNGGMVFYGGFLGAVLGSSIYCRIHRVRFFTVADIIAPTIILAQAIGRVGCFLAGCCHGKQCDLPWAVTFENPLSIAPLHIPLHPTQLYEMVGDLAIVGLLLLIQRRQKFEGQILVGYLCLYAVLRSIVEVYRGDTIRGFVTFWDLYPNEWLSTSTFISAMMFAVAIIIWYKQRNIPTPLKVSSNS